jgi:DNA-binding NarL/FixJ family response regulator
MSTITFEIPQNQLLILEYLASGLTKKEIATRIDTSNKNVERIIYAMIAQYNCKNSTELVAYMVTAGVICYKRA